MCQQALCIMEHSIEQSVNIAMVPNNIWTFYFLIIAYLILPRMNLLVYFRVLIDLLLAIMFQNCFSYKSLTLTVSSHWSYLTALPMSFQMANNLRI